MRCVMKININKQKMYFIFDDRKFAYLYMFVLFSTHFILSRFVFGIERPSMLSLDPINKLDDIIKFQFLF